MSNQLNAHVVRHSNTKIENFFKVDCISRDLFDQETWVRNDIVEVHVVTLTQGFVAKDALQLAHLMKQARAETDPLPLQLLRRQDGEKPSPKFLQ